MLKKFWYKSAALVALTGTVLSLGYGGGCMSAMIQRVLVAVAFD